MRLIKLLLIFLLLAAALPSAALAAEQAAPSEPTAIAPQESGEEIITSDETLATSIFIPFCFIAGTLAVFVWAIRNRARRQEEEEPMPWWRTHEWYTRGAEDEEA